MKTRKVDVKITEPDGTVVFQKDQFEVPEFWSDRAATIVASKYATDTEFSVIDIVNRVVDQITTWGIEQGYFDIKNGLSTSVVDSASEFSIKLIDILLNQRAAFNSPVWFNCGVAENNNQMSACFILPLEDTIDSILQHTVTEGNIFKGGSGTGINVSKLRAKGERLSNKGEASGPISFMRGHDAFAGVIKSGGKTRRAAKLVCMDVDHPDIMEFIECKKAEEDKAKILIANGISPEEAYTTVDFQNANHSIRVSEEFMDAIEDDSPWELVNRGDKKTTIVNAKDILRRTAEIAWETGDPGIQFDCAMNQDNPVPSLGDIHSTNPCSEFSAVDNSSCNLASLNLVKYLTKDKELNDDLFENDIDIIITAMDILIDVADYPTPEIRKMTTETRPLGLGFTNLGAYLMLQGISYDSNEARNEAAFITRKMTNAAYRRSSELAEKLGSFKVFEENKERCIEIARRLVYADYNQWANEAEQRIREQGLRNSQLTLLAPTGTISFMMDCDTTGIEPLFALKSTKALAGGGTMEIIPWCVDEKSTELGGQPEDFIPEYRAIFKTANEIHWRDHILMMAACQKHINGAISKTINMPSSCTVDDIMEAYQFAWEYGLKALAIYRDGSKGMQPLSSGDKKEVNKDKPTEITWNAIRHKPENTRASLTHKFDVTGHEGYVTAGMYNDGTLCEIFIRMAKEGTTVSGLMDAFATAVSLGLQYGVPIEKFIEKYSETKFEPAGFTQNPDIRITTSLVDYIFRWLKLEFVDEDEELEDIESNMEDIILPPQNTKVSFDGPPCQVCHSITSKVGTCYLCSNCGTTTGCS